MSNADTLKAVFDAIAAQDWATFESLIGDEFQLVGPTPKPVSKDEWLGLHKQLAEAFPDFKFNPQEFSEENDEAVCFIQITATHTGTLNLPMMGVENVAATGTEVKLPREMVIAKVTGDKIVHLVSHGPDSGGVAGLLAQIGVEPPG